LNSKLENAQARELSRRKFLAITTLSGASFLLLQGCGGSQILPPINNGEIIVRPEVRVLPSDGSVTIVEVAQGSVRLSGSVPPLAPGSVVVSGEDAGLMQKVISVRTEGGVTILETEDAGLDDVFEQADIKISQDLGVENFSEIQLHQEGVSIGDVGRADVELPIILKKVKVGKTIGDVEAMVEISGDAFLKIGLDFDFKIDSQGLLQAKGAVRGGMGIRNYKITGQLVQSLAKVEIPLATLIGVPFTVFVGPVPIVLLPVLFIFVKVEGKVEVGVEFTGNAEIILEGGFDFVRGNGFTPFVDLNTTSSDQQFKAVFTDLKLEAAPALAELTTSFNGISGPFFKLAMPNFDLELRANAISQDLQVILNAGIKGSTGAKAGLLGKGIPLFELTIVDVKRPLFNSNVPPGNGEVIIK
jgi:hypothetical protein